MHDGDELWSKGFRHHFRDLWRSLLKLLKQSRRQPSKELVHRLRVVSREIESVLELFRFAMGPSHVRNCLRWATLLRRAGGRVRDLDVQLGLVQYLWGSSGEMESLGDFMEFLEGRRKKCAAKMRRRLGKLDADALESDFASLEARLERALNQGVVSPFVSRFMEGLLVAEKMDQQCLREVVISAELHDLRLQFKQVRFMGQFLNALGQIHIDQQVFEDILRFHKACGYCNDAEQLNRSFDHYCSQVVEPDRELQLRVLARLLKYRHSQRADLLVQIDWARLAQVAQQH